MSEFDQYAVRAFSPTQYFLVDNPSTGTLARVLGSDLVSYLTPSVNPVFGETTRAAAAAGDYSIGRLIQTAGGDAIGDGGNGLYLVVAEGEGDYPMINGNELLLLPFGTLVGSDLDGALVTDDGEQVAIEDAIAKRTATFATLEDLRASECSYDTVTVTRAVSGGPVVNMVLYKDGTGTATTAPNIFSDLAAGTFCNAAGNCYKLVVGPSINAECFGATRDGTTVDASFIQYAVDYISNLGGGVVTLSPGQYNLGTSAVNIKSKCVLSGSGNNQFGSDSSDVAASSTILLYAGSDYAVNLGDGTYNCYGGGLKNLAINGQGVGVNGIRIQGAVGGASVGSFLKNILVNNVTTTGILCGRYSWVGDFLHVNARNCATGFYLAAENNRYNLFGCDASTCTTGFLIGDGLAVNQVGISIFGGRAENVEYGVDVSANSRTVNLFGMYIESFSTRGVVKRSGSTNLTMLGCVVNGSSGGSHIYILGGGVINIQGNEFTGSVVNEIDLGSNAVYGTVGGNYHGSTISGSRITPPISGSIVNFQDTGSGVQAVHRAHEFNSGTFTPTWTNLTVGDASVNSGQYAEIGDLVAVTVKLKWGSTTSASGAFYVNNLPKTADAVLPAYGTGNALDSGTANYPVNCTATAGTTNLTPLVLNAAGTYLTQAAISATVPFTWTTDDELVMTIVYHK